MSRRKKLDPVTGVFVDGLRPVEVHGGEFMIGARMFSLPGMTDQLHAMAFQIGLKRGWFEDACDLPAYWIGEWAHSSALRRGAMLADDDVVREATRTWECVTVAQRGVALRKQAEMACLATRRVGFTRGIVQRALSAAEVHEGFRVCRERLMGGRPNVAGRAQ